MPFLKLRVFRDSCRPAHPFDELRFAARPFAEAWPRRNPEVLNVQYRPPEPGYQASRLDEHRTPAGFASLQGRHEVRPSDGRTRLPKDEGPRRQIGGERTSPFSIGWLCRAARASAAASSPIHKLEKGPATAGLRGKGLPHGNEGRPGYLPRRPEGPSGFASPQTRLARTSFKMPLLNCAHVPKNLSSVAVAAPSR